MSRNISVERGKLVGHGVKRSVTEAVLSFSQVLRLPVRCV